jgi:plastin-1
LILLQALDKVRPGIVNWKNVSTKTPISSRFKRVENTNYVIVLGKSLHFSLVGIQGADLTDGVKNLTLGIKSKQYKSYVDKLTQSRFCLATDERACCVYPPDDCKRREAYFR